MLIPDHLHFASISETDRQIFDVHLRYWVLETEACLVAAYFGMGGRTDGQPFNGNFELPHDATMHFTGRASRLVRRHGLCSRRGPIVRQRCECDVMFGDLHRCLKLKSDEAVNLNRYLHDEAGVS